MSINRHQSFRPPLIASPAQRRQPMGVHITATVEVASTVANTIAAPQETRIRRLQNRGAMVARG